ncbi:hypothetical protein [Cupriavidus sp. H39]|uniref:hypothetical protein n=1 Tax=Cupriavidus sp. H39 TaxID=3401635 RepID=UPI003D013B6F
MVVEYALRGMGNPIGVAQYQFVAELAAELQESLPSVETLTGSWNWKYGPRWRLE